jgi:hypothetical protein
MKMPPPTVLAVAAGLGVGLVVLYQARQAAGAVADAVRNGAINPASSNNLAYKSVNAVGGAVTGNENFSLGAWLYEVTHPGVVAAEDAAVHATPTAALPAYATDTTPTFAAGSAPGGWYSGSNFQFVSLGGP